MGIPLISVIMPVYNREEWLDEAIVSIFRQTHTHFELIIADDGSTDGSASIIKKYAARARRIRAFFFRHRGIAKTLNAAGAAARGSFIAYADSDDISLPQRLAVQAGWMHDAGLDICGAQGDVFGARKDLSGWHEGIHKLPESPEAVRREMLFRIAVWRGAMMIRTEVQRRHPFHESSDFTDCDWLLKTAMTCRMGNVPATLVRVRRHGQNITSVKNLTFSRELAKARFNYFYFLFPHTSLDDYLAFRRLADGAAMQSLQELEKAGMWAARLADCHEKAFRRIMLRRWQAACDRAAHLDETRVRRISKTFRKAIEENTNGENGHGAY